MNALKKQLAIIVDNLLFLGSFECSHQSWKWRILRVRNMHYRLYDKSSSLNNIISRIPHTSWRTDTFSLAIQLSSKQNKMREKLNTSTPKYILQTTMTFLLVLCCWPHTDLHKHKKRKPSPSLLLLFLLKPADTATSSIGGANGKQLYPQATLPYKKVAWK